MMAGTTHICSLDQGPEIILLNAALTKGRQDGGRPEDLAHQRRYEEEAAHALPIQLLEGIQHGDVTSRAHGLGEEQPPWDRRETEAHPQDLTVVLLT